MKECITHHHACDCREAQFKKLEAENAALRKALTIGGRECAEIEFGAEHEHIEILAKGTSAGWMNRALQEQEDD